MIFNMLSEYDRLLPFHTTIGTRSKMIKIKHNVNGVAIDEKRIIVSYYEPFYNSEAKTFCFNAGIQPLNNIVAYNHDGDLIWDIKDIMVKDVSLPKIEDTDDIYSNIEIFNKEKLPYASLRDFDINLLLDDRNYLFCCGNSGRRYVIDLETLEVLYKKGFRF